MEANEHLTIKLSAVTAQRLRARVASGNYQDASAVVEEALASLDTLDEHSDPLVPALDEARIEHWLRTDVVKIYDEMKRNPSRAIPLEDAVARLRLERAMRGE